MLAVSDSGMGMSPETVAHIFEPFFTTKAEHAERDWSLDQLRIVKQSAVTSGYTANSSMHTFKVYCLEWMKVPSCRRRAIDTAPQKGTETILLVEDEEAVP